MRTSYVFLFLLTPIILTVSCKKTEETSSSSIRIEKEENGNKSIEGRLELGHKPGTKDSTAYYITFGKKRYYFMDGVPDLESYKDKDLVVEGEFVLKDFPGVFYMNKSDLPTGNHPVPQGLMHTDKEEYEENKTYFQIMNPVLKIR